MNTKTSFRVVMSVLLVLLSVGLAGTAPTFANGNGELNPSFQHHIEGGIVAGGVGLRGSGTGVIDISGIPGGASIFRAYLYWATLGNSNTFTSPTLNGQTVTGDLIGRSGDTCWGVQHNYVYRAEVTSFVTGNGNYTIDGLPDSLNDGNDSQGASLVVLYELPGAPLRTVLINDGAVALDFDQTSHTDTIGGYTLADPVADAEVIYLIGDGQATWDAGNVTFNDTPIASGIFSGVDGDYWGTHRFDVTELVSESPSTTTIDNHDPDNPDSPDCLLWAATILSVTPEEQQDPSNSMSQFLNVEIIGDVTSAGVGLRGTGTGTIQLSGIPAQASVTDAFLYWATLGNSGAYASPLLEGTEVDGELIGASADTCWGAMRNYVYRADVSDLVTRNGDYTISGLPDNLATGNDSQGASLVAIYRVSGSARTVIINDGAVTLDFETSSFTDTLGEFFADQPNAEAHVTYLIGDGQERWDTGNVTFEGTSIAQNAFTGVDGDYWGTLTFDVTGLVTEPEVTTTLSNEDPDNPDSPDCLLWAATVFSVETEEGVLADEFAYLPFIINGVSSR